jgi:hypothetical protein
MYSNSANKLNLIKDMQKEKDFYTYSTKIKDKIKNVIKKLTY